VWGAGDLLVRVEGPNRPFNEFAGNQHKIGQLHFPALLRGSYVTARRRDPGRKPIDKASCKLRLSVLPCRVKANRHIVDAGFTQAFCCLERPKRTIFISMDCRDGRPTALAGHRSPATGIRLLREVLAIPADTSQKQSS